MSAVADGTYKIRSVKFKENFLDKDPKGKVCATKGVLDKWIVKADPSDSFCTITYAGSGAPQSLTVLVTKTPSGTNNIGFHTKSKAHIPHAQGWKIIDTEDRGSRKYIIVTHSDEDYALGVKGTGHSVDCVLVASNTTSPAQQWYFEEV